MLAIPKEDFACEARPSVGDIWMPCKASQQTGDGSLSDRPVIKIDVARRQESLLTHRLQIISKRAQLINQVPPGPTEPMMGIVYGHPSLTEQKSINSQAVGRGAFESNASVSRTDVCLQPKITDFNNFNYLFQVIFDNPHCSSFLALMETILPGDLIRAARALLGWSQEKLAMESGITAKSLRDIESGTRRPTRKTNGQIRAVLERENVQFIAANHDGSEIVGAGVRWRPEQSNMTIKII